MLVPFCFYRGFFNEEKTGNAQKQDNRADDTEN